MSQAVKMLHAANGMLNDDPSFGMRAIRLLLFISQLR
jgi:hypothetical protein